MILAPSEPKTWPDQPDGTRGIDQFIGEADLIDRGHGTALVRVFVDGFVCRRHTARGDRPRPGQYPCCALL